METDFRTRFDPLGRLRGAHAPPPDEAAAAAEPPVVSAAAYSLVSADRRQKQMLELRLKTGTAKALAYSYLVAIDFDPSAGITLDFSGWVVVLTGRHLGPLFAALVAHRVAVVTECDDLHAEATLAADATVVTGIEVTPRNG